MNYLTKMLILGFILICKVSLIYGQTKIEVNEINSICVVLYEGMKHYPLIQIPSDFNDSLELQQSKEDYRLEIEKRIGKVDTSYEMQPSLTHELINKAGKYNPTIIWSSKKCFNKDQSEKILDFINCETYEEDPVNTPMECYIPRHGLIFYDKSDQILSTLAVCFQCNNSKVNDDYGFYNCVDYYSLQQVFKELGIQMFENDKEFKEYQLNGNEEKRKKNWPLQLVAVEKRKIIHCPNGARRLPYALLIIEKKLILFDSQQSEHS